MWKKKKREQVVGFNAEKLFLAAAQPLSMLYSYCHTAPGGLHVSEVEHRQSLYGKNEVEHEKRKNPVSVFIQAFINPFIGVLTGLLIISFVLDVLWAEPGEQDWITIVVISTMVVFSAILRFCQEWKASASSGALLKMVTNTCYVKREGQPDEEISIAELVPGDVVMIAAGDMIPADLRLVQAKDLFVSQSSLSGESVPIEKCAVQKEKQGGRGSVVELDNICFMGTNVVSGSATGQSSLSGESVPIEKCAVQKEKQGGRGSVVELDNICFMGTNVVSGSATGIVLATGNHAYLGAIAKNISGHRAATAFDKGISKVSFLLIRFMLVMIPFVFLVNGLKGDQ